jgi:chemotaxis protein MotB
LTEAEAARLADAAALQALRDRLANADTELTAMTLALEEERKRAEETLTLLAAARTEAAKGATEKDAALAAAETALLEEQEKVLAAAREVELLNQQVAACAASLAACRRCWTIPRRGTRRRRCSWKALGKDLNAALAQVAAEQRRRAELEAAEAAPGWPRRTAISRGSGPSSSGSCPTFWPAGRACGWWGTASSSPRKCCSTRGSADLALEGRLQIAGVVSILDEVRAEIPPEIDWIIRVDGHTDNVPLSGAGPSPTTGSSARRGRCRWCASCRTSWASRPSGWPRPGSGSTGPWPPGRRRGWRGRRTGGSS